MSRIILAAVGSGSGKTLITCGLIKSLTDRGTSVRAYKCGPDYIDPLFHKNILGVPSENLDTFFSDEAHLKQMLSIGAGADISVIEGVMGIYDGLGGTESAGSTYDLACKTDTPVILIVNARGMGRTVVSIIKGILADDTHNLIKGIILNNVSHSYYDQIGKIIESETNIKTLGYLPQVKNINIESRHLGLKLPHEIDDLNNQLSRLTEAMTESVDIEEIVKIANDCEKITLTQASNNTNTLIKSRAKIAVAQDEVFCFIYEENIRILEQEGLEVVYFSPLHDKNLPEGISGILLPGGYPELKLQELEKNKSMRHSIRRAINEGMPTIAECGGFMYLHEYITGEDGTDYEMVGAIDGKCYNTGKLCRFGYVNISINIGDKATAESKIGEHKYDSSHIIRGHEFHYYDSTAPGTDMQAVKPTTGKSWSFGYVGPSKLWGYPHLYYASCREFIHTITEEIIKFSDK